MSSVNISRDFNNGSSLQENFRCVFSKDSFPAQISKILACVILLLSSLVGNILIIMIVHRRPELRKTINFFIVNMAVSDFVFPLTAIPVTITEIATGSLEWPIGGTAGLIFCKLKWFLKAVSITVSVQSLIWIAVDRFVAVVFPMKVHLISSCSRPLAIASTWIVAMTANAFHFDAFELVKENEEVICSNFYNTSYLYMTYSKIYTVILQIAPLIGMSILYSAIAVSLRRQDKALRSPSVQKVHQSKRRAIKMALCVMAAFYICVLPMLSYFILWEYEVKLPCSFSKELLFIASLMLYLSSTINPVICMAFVQSYRDGLRDIFYWCWCNRLTTSNNETCEQEEISLRQIRTGQYTGTM